MRRSMADGAKGTLSQLNETRTRSVHLGTPRTANLHNYLRGPRHREPAVADLGRTQNPNIESIWNKAGVEILRAERGPWRPTWAG
jgi:hypothetical protein